MDPNGDPVPPGIIGGQVAGAHLGRQPLVVRRRPGQRQPGKGVQPAQQHVAEHGDAAHLDPERQGRLVPLAVSAGCLAARRLDLGPVAPVLWVGPVRACVRLPSMVLLLVAVAAPVARRLPQLLFARPTAASFA